MKWRGFGVVAFLLAASLLCAQVQAERRQAARSAPARKSMPCPAAAGGDPDGDYIIAGTVADVPYGRGQTMDVYAPAGEPRPAAVVIRGRHGNQFDFVTKLYEQLTRAGYA